MPGNIKTIGPDVNSQDLNDNFSDYLAHLADYTPHGTDQLELQYYVDSVNGNDNNPGTNVEPFKTIKKAIDSIPTSGVGIIQLKDAGPHIIDSVIQISNKVIRFDTAPTSITKDIQVTAMIQVTNSVILDAGGIRFYVDGTLFKVSGLSLIRLGGYYSTRIYPLNSDSNVNFIYVHGMGTYFYNQAAQCTLVGNRMQFLTDNHASYTGTFNIFSRDVNYEEGIILSKFNEFTKDTNVNWGLTEYILGGGLSQWHR